jgi:hypothetical protein
MVAGGWIDVGETAGNEIVVSWEEGGELSV